MPKRNDPDTSKAAYKAVSVEMLNSHHSKILKALKVLGAATYEEIATHLTWDDKNRASRRLKELEGMELVWKPGAKKPTKSGRSAYVYQLRGDAQPRTEKEIKYISGEKTATDYAGELISISKNPRYTQTELL